MDDSAFPIDALRAQIKGAEGFTSVARATAQYYDALIKAGLPKPLAESLALHGLAPWPCRSQARARIDNDEGGG